MLPFSPSPAEVAGGCIAAKSHFLDKLRLQAHGANAIDFTIDVVIAVDQANVLDPGPHFYDRGGAFQFQVLDDYDCIAIP